MFWDLSFALFGNDETSAEVGVIVLEIFITVTVESFVCASRVSR